MQSCPAYKTEVFAVIIELAKKARSNISVIFINNGCNIVNQNKPIHQDNLIDNFQLDYWLQQQHINDIDHIYIEHQFTPKSILVSHSLKSDLLRGKLNCVLLTICQLNFLHLFCTSCTIR